jgi:hypothetical protein
MEYIMHGHFPLLERLAFSMVIAFAVICAAFWLGHRYSAFDDTTLTRTFDLCFDDVVMCQDRVVVYSGSGCGLAAHTSIDGRPQSGSADQCFIPGVP